MRLANDNFTLSIGARRFTLRPTLRAAFYLETKYEGLQKLCAAVANGSYDACVDLIAASCTDQKLWAVYITTARKPLAELFEARDQLLTFVRRLAGDDPGTDKAAPDGKPLSFEEYHTQLFQIATGWLGWSPDQAWNATPAEIINAKMGRNAMFAAIFGNGKTAGEEQTVDIHDPDARAALNKLGDLNVTSMGGL